MASWGDFVRAEPDFANEVRERFDAYRHKFLGTLTSSGAPRVSGIETMFDDENLWLGGMKGSVKLLDMRRDPRISLHSGSDEPDDENPFAWRGDAKLAGRAHEVIDAEEWRRLVGDEGPPGDLFRVDIEMVSLVKAGGPDHVVVRTWLPGQPIKSSKRY